jgi:hypothetical protein
MLQSVLRQISKEERARLKGESKFYNTGIIPVVYDNTILKNGLFTVKDKQDYIIQHHVPQSIITELSQHSTVAFVETFTAPYNLCIQSLNDARIFCNKRPPESLCYCVDIRQYNELFYTLIALNRAPKDRWVICKLPNDKCWKMLLSGISYIMHMYSDIGMWQDGNNRFIAWHGCKTRFDVKKILIDYIEEIESDNEIYSITHPDLITPYIIEVASILK